ncbi:hypothetical protein L1049_000512 [Liquidambar formosana]|uniref:F-box protein n=1 Tax=Liquidambar formosana TaxID=63359 RepID=A0AAP0NAL3_LIQFO
MKKQQNPPWEDLNPFLLSKIFSHLPIHDQLFGPPFVCHSWLSATLETLFHNSILDLRLIDSLDDENQLSRFYHLLTLAINHHQDWVSIYFPNEQVFGYFATLYIAEQTPTISSVVLPSDSCSNALPIYMSLLYWRNLRVFRARLDQSAWLSVLSQLADFCENIVELGIHGDIEEKEVAYVVECFPRLEVLDFSESTLCGNALGVVLDGRLKRLKELNILHCLIMGEDGEYVSADEYAKSKAFKNEVLQKASGLRSLKKFRYCCDKSCTYCN